MDLNIRSTESPDSDLDHTVGSWFLGQLERFFQEELKDEYGIETILAKTTTTEHLEKLPPQTSTSLNVIMDKSDDGWNEKGYEKGEVQAVFYDQENEQAVAKITVDVRIGFKPDWER